MSLIPKVDASLKNFFIKIFVLALGWKLLHLYILGPLRIPDSFLTDLVTSGTVFLTNALDVIQVHVSWLKPLAAHGTANSIMYNGQSIFLIDDTCNGLEIMLIYVGILLILPIKSVGRVSFFIFSGLIVLIVANMIRCTALLWIYSYHKPYFDINHHYIFTFLMYGIIVAGWLLYLKQEKSEESPA